MGGLGGVVASHWLKHFLSQLENVILPAEALQCVLQRGRATREKERECVRDKERERERERVRRGWAGKTSHMHKEGARGTETERASV